MYGRRLSVWKWHVLTNRRAADSVRLWSNKHGGVTWTTSEWTIYKRLFNTHLLRLHYWPYLHSWRSESSRWMNNVAPKQAHHPLKVPGETPSPTTHTTMNCKENDWSCHPDARSCMHMHAHACRWMECMEWVLSGHAYAHICMHMHSYGYTCIHMHAESV